MNTKIRKIKYDRKARNIKIVISPNNKLEYLTSLGEHQNYSRNTNENASINNPKTKWLNINKVLRVIKD